MCLFQFKTYLSKWYPGSNLVSNKKCPFHSILSVQTDNLFYVQSKVVLKLRNTKNIEIVLWKFGAGE